MARPLQRLAVLVAAAFTLVACAAPGSGTAARPDATGGPGASSGGPGGGSGSPPSPVTTAPPITQPPGPTGPPTPPTNRPPTGAPTLVTGVVDAEPGCPGPVTDPPCPARPVPGALVDVTGPGGSAASTVTDKDGRFSLRLAPGTYRFTVTGGLHSRVTKLVHVPISAPVELTVDSGMR